MDETNFLQQHNHCPTCHYDYPPNIMHNCPSVPSLTPCIRCTNLKDLSGVLEKIGKSWKYCPHCGKDLN